MTHPADQAQDPRRSSSQRALPLRFNPVDRLLPDQYASTVCKFASDGIDANRIIV